MAAALTAVPAPASATVTVTVSGFTNPWTLTRTDPDGVQRLVAGASGITWNLAVVDHRCPFGVAVTYTATDGTVTVTAVTTLAVTVPWLSRPDSTTADRTCTIVTDEARLSTDRSTVHWVIGRGDPIVVGEVVKYRAGTLTLLAQDVNEATALAGLWSDGLPVLLRVPAGAVVRGGWLAAVGDLTEQVWIGDPVPGGLPNGARQCSIAYQRVGEPDSRPPLPAVWVWTDVPTWYANWTSAQASFTTWDELANHTPGA